MAKPTIRGSEASPRWPHFPQNFEFSGRGVRHRGHGAMPGCSAGTISENAAPPQRPQNLTPSAYRAPHAVHPTIPGKRLDCGDPPVLEPCEGDGWLPSPEKCRSCAWITCSFAPSRISITRSSSFSPAFETRRMWRPGGMSVSTSCQGKECACAGEERKPP